MRYVVLLIALSPIICCQQCDQTWICVILFASTATILHVIFSISHELRLLAKFGQSARWPR